jgi:hypothetical protein
MKRPRYNIWNKWDPLKVCMLGNNYAPEFFNGVNDKVADPLKRICEETLEDLDGFKTTLQQFGVEVIQPMMDPNERFMDNPGHYPRGPLQPRDSYLVLGNDCYETVGDHDAIGEALEEYGPVTRAREQMGFGMSSAMAFMLGTRIDVGIDADHGEQLVRDYGSYLPGYMPAFRDFDVNFVPTDGHTDGNFHPIKPGAILSLHDVQTYSETYPGWDVCYLPDQSWHKVNKFVELKVKNIGKWWMAGEEDNDEFTYFVETWLKDWVGYVEETVFDVNVLMIDQHHCCVSNPHNEQVNAFLRKHHVEPVYVPWRHRYFWDGGLHCITLDLHREGTQKDYFKGRQL